MQFNYFTVLLYECQHITDKSAVDLDSVYVNADKSTVDLDSVDVNADEISVDLDSVDVKADESAVDLDIVDVNADENAVGLDSVDVNADNYVNKRKKYILNNRNVSGIDNVINEYIKSTADICQSI